MTSVAAPRQAQDAQAEAPRRSSPRTRVERSLVATAVTLSFVLPVLQLRDADVPGRLPLAVAFVLLAPGVPLAVLLRLADGLAAVAVGLALSLSTLLILSTLLLVAGAWSPVVVMATLALVTVLLAPYAWRSAGGWVRESRPVRPLLPRLLSLGALVVALGLWWVQVQRLRPEEIAATGLAGAVGWPHVAALVVVALVGAVQLQQSEPDPAVMTAVASTLVVMLFGLLNLADSGASFRTAYVHAGFIEHITENGAVATGFDARFSWPGFFAAGAVLVDLAGLQDATPLIRLAPVVYNALAVPALLVIGTVLGGSRRVAWCGVLLYACMNWFSQDYLSPQATVLLLYLAVLAVLLVAVRPDPQPNPSPLRRVLVSWGRVPPRAPWLTARREVVLELALVLVAVAMVLSHQLTPVMLIGILLAFTLTGTTRYRLLWLVVALAFLSWFSYGAEDFWRGHLDQVFGDIGRFGSTLGSSVGARLQGDPVYGSMQQLRLLSSAAWLVLGVIGLWHRRRDPRAVLFAALAFGPFALVAVQSYGGEILLRSFVYALPSLAPLVAVALLRALDPLPWPSLRVVPLTALLVTVSLLLTATRGANAGFERISSSHITAARILLAAVPAGSRVGLLADAGPLGLDRLVEVDTITLSPERCAEAGVSAQDVAACALAEEVDYVFVSSTMDVLGQLRYGRPAGWTGRVVEELVASRQYFHVQRRPDALVLARVDESAG